MNREQTQPSICACPDCDLLIAANPAKRHHIAKCPRCGKTLYKNISNSVNNALSLAITGLCLYIPALFLPLITLSSFGMKDSGNVIETITFFFTQKYYFVAIMIMLSAGIFPLVLLSCIAFISFQLKRKRWSSSLPVLFKRYIHLQEWAMIEVYLLGIVITIIKMKSDADIGFEPGFFFFSILVVITIAMGSVVDKRLFWKKIEYLSGRVTPPPAMPIRKTYNAKEAGYKLCTTCKKLVDLRTEICPRCGEKIWPRKPRAISRTWALLTTSIILFFPANMLPIMQVNFLGIPDKSTILDGIIYFFVDGAYGIGIIILTASILVPIFKVLGLGIILMSIHLKKGQFLREKARMFRFIEFIGRWSMLDIFVIALLTVMVDFGFFTSIEVAPAATYFCLVVVSTMLAAITFDPRLLWDTFTPKSTGNM